MFSLVGPFLTLGEKAEKLYGDKRRHGNHGYDAKGVCYDIAAHGAAGALRQRKQKQDILEKLGKNARQDVSGRKEQLKLELGEIEAMLGAW